MKLRGVIAVLSVCAWWIAAAGRPSAGQQASGWSALVDPGQTASRVGATMIGIGNRAFMATWSTTGGRLRPAAFEDRLTSRKIPVPAEAFVLTLEGGLTVKASDLRVSGTARVEPLTQAPRAPRFSDRIPGRQIVLALAERGGAFTATWRAVVRDGANYLRQELEIAAGDADVPLRRIDFFDMAVPGAAVAGSVPGSPVVASTAFMGIEHPMSECTVEAGHVRCGLAREVPVRSGQRFRAASVVGVTPAGQLRRGMLAYLERERAHPYRTFLHYNSWYDIGYFSRFDEQASLDAVAAYGRELVTKRSVKLDSFLFDDGWDDPQTLWQVHDGFPNGFTALREATKRAGSAPGVWLSPWGGYGEPKKQRLAFGAEQGFETNEDGFALSGPIYYRRFRDTCLSFVRAYGVNQFKFDGIGRATGAQPGSAFGSDFEAAIQIIDDLRAERPDVYINLTTGTWPSPFWLRHADSIWRGGEDHEFTGVGSDRQQWITYRDAETYHNIVRAGPLYPLSSLMLHGLVYARHAKRLDTDPGGDFTAEVRSYFGSGTQLQEMYITPALLSGQDWDVLAESARWARRNAAVLVDTHWVGGDPAKLEVYGWASWAPARGHLVLRNPSDRPATFVLVLQDVLELPSEQPRAWRGQSPWRDDRARAPIDFEAATPRTIELRPFEVLTLDLAPVAGTSQPRASIRQDGDGSGRQERRHWAHSARSPE